MSPGRLSPLALVSAALVGCALAACPSPKKPQPQGPTPPPPMASAASIEGTDWTGTDGGERVNFYFRKGGVLHYRDASGWWEDGTWTQNGTLILFNTGDGFASYNGRVYGDALSGGATNRKNKSWSFELHRGTPRQPGAMDLTGQMWGGTESDQWVTFYFKAGGVLEYDTPQGYFTDATYEVDGAWVYFKMAGDKLEYFGAVDGDRMSGNAWSPANKRWSWSVARGQNANPGSGAPQPAATPTVQGTTWEGNNGGDWLTVRFDPDGKLWAKDDEGELDGTWYQSGNSLTFEMSGGYVTYSATVDGAVMKGKAQNKGGNAWDFELTRK